MPTTKAITPEPQKPVFIPPKRRIPSGKSNTYTPTRSVIYGDQILNVQGRTPAGSSDNLSGDGVDRDVLGSLERLERLPTGSMGTMRSIRSNGSIPTLERVRREESNHSIGSHSQTSSGQVSERSTDIDLVREAVHTKRSLRTSRKHSSTRLSRPGSESASAATSIDDLDRISVVTTEEKVRSIQRRPLPNLPPEEQQPKLQLRIIENEDAIEILNSEKESVGGSGVMVSLRHEGQNSHEKAALIKPSSNGFLTVTGTIKRGKNKGESFDVHLKMNRDLLAKIERDAEEKERSSCLCGLNRGLHIFILSVLCIPFLWIFCTFYAFYMGTLTWYNIFIYYNEQRTCCHTIFVSPCVLLIYPVWILPVTLGLGLYGGVSQVSWYWSNWRKELTDPEKGFYGWFCNKLALPDCAPYQVVILTSLEDTEDPNTITSVI